MITKLRSDPTLPEPKVFSFDAEMERKRKDQLNRLWKRTPEQVSTNVFTKSHLNSKTIRNWISRRK